MYVLYIECTWVTIPIHCMNFNSFSTHAEESWLTSYIPKKMSLITLAFQKSENNVLTSCLSDYVKGSISINVKFSIYQVSTRNIRFSRHNESLPSKKKCDFYELAFVWLSVSLVSKLSFFRIYSKSTANRFLFKLLFCFHSVQISSANFVWNIRGVAIK